VITLLGEPPLEIEGVIQSARPLWVLSHPHPLYGGSMHNKIIDQLFVRAVDRGVSVLRYNFRGVGQSAGKFDNGRGECDDLLRVITHVVEDFEVLLQDIHLIGYSFGSYVSALVAQRFTDLFKLSLIAPPTQWKVFPDLKCSFPVEIYMPCKDEYTQWSHAKAYFNTIDGPKTWIDIDHANHFFVGTTKKMMDVFLQKQNLVQ